MAGNALLGGMAGVRLVSGLIEILAALLFIRLGRVDTALRINAALGLIGPLVFVVVSALGLVAMAVRLSPLKIVLLTTGIILVLIGTKS